jgi:hypothetical protein
MSSWQSLSLDAAAASYLRARLARVLAFDARDARHAVRAAAATPGAPPATTVAAAASVSIRRGGASRVAMFDLSLTLRWEGRSVLGAARASTGEACFEDLMPEDVYELAAPAAAAAAGAGAGAGAGAVTGAATAPAATAVSRWLDFPVRVTQRDAVAGLEVDSASLAVAREQLVQALRDAVRDFASLLLRIADGSAPPDALAAEAARLSAEWPREQAAIEARLRELAEEALERKTAADAAARVAAARAPKRLAPAAPTPSPVPARAPAPAPALTPAPAPSAPAPADAGAATSSAAASCGGVAQSPLAAAAADAEALAKLAEATTLDHVVSLDGKAVAAGAAPSLEPSLWNVAAWAWEEREFTPWARARLNELLAGVDVDVPSGHVRIVEVESVKGDASVNLRKVRGARSCAPHA